MLFTTGKGGILTAIDMGIPADSINYEIKVYNSFSGGRPGGLITTEYGFAEKAGYYTAPISSKVVLEDNQDFFISLKTATYGISLDFNSEISGRSFLSSDGNIFNSINYNFNLRARISTIANQPNLIVEEFVNNSNNWEININDSDYQVTGIISDGKYALEQWRTQKGYAYRIYRINIDHNNYSI